MENKDYRLTEKDILDDFKIDFDELYEAQMQTNGKDAVTLSFSNGQKFEIRIKEIQ